MKCPKCNSKEIEEVKKGLVLKCRKCNYQSFLAKFLEEGESLKSNTVRHYERKGEEIVRVNEPLSKKEIRKRQGIELDNPLRNNKDYLFFRTFLDELLENDKRNFGKNHSPLKGIRHRKFTLNQIHRILQIYGNYVSISKLKQYKKYLKSK